MSHLYFRLDAGATIESAGDGNDKAEEEADAEAEAYDHDKQRKPGHNKVDSDHLWSSLSHCLLRSLSLLRASELFDLVVEFPDSLCTAREFKEAAAASNSIGAVGKIFRETVRRRLLHSGAGTAQIIDFYINMIPHLFM